VPQTHVQSLFGKLDERKSDFIRREISMQYATCNHLKEDGVYCGSPALAGRNYCYFHLARRALAHRRGQPYRPYLPMFENMHAIQATLHDVLESLVEGRLDTKAAGLLLYGLQQASANLNNPFWGGQCPNLDEDEDGRALDYPAFEQTFGVPQGIDLEAEPELALQQAEQRSETLPPPQKQPEPQPQPMPNCTKKRVSSRLSGDDGPSFQELQQQLQYVKQIQMAANQDAKKPAASISPQKESMTNSA
jgi:hypothetical protein